MFHRTSLLTLALAAVLFTAAAVVAPQAAHAAPCELTGQKLVDAHVAGTVFTDLAGPNKAGKGEMTVRNNSNCVVKEALGIFRSTTTRPPANQKLHDMVYVTVAPHSTQTVTAAIPSCTFQADAFTGHPAKNDQINVSIYKVLYGEIVNDGHYCDNANNTPTPTPTPVTDPAPCTLEGQALVNAHVAGTVFSDLAGPSKAGIGEVTVRNDSNCTVKETLGSYRSTTTRPPANQKMIEVKHLTIAPHSTITARVGIVPCTYQIDIFAGHAPAGDQTNIGLYPVLYGEIVNDGNYCDANHTPTPTPTPTVTPTVTPTPTPTNSPTPTPNPSNCVLDGQALIAAHLDGRVFTDLAGANKAGIGEMTVRNNSNCEVHETLGSYRSTTTTPPANQKFYDIAYATVAPHSTQTFRVSIPTNCIYQIDAFAGFAPATDQTNLNLYPIIYGEVVTRGGFCDTTTPIPNRPPHRDHRIPNRPTNSNNNNNGNANNNSNSQPVNITNNITNNNTNNNESHGGNATVERSGNATIGNITLSQAQPRVLGASNVKYSSYAAYSGTPVSVPITAQTGPEGLLAFATLSSGSGLAWTIKRLLTK